MSDEELSYMRAADSKKLFDRLIVANFNKTLLGGGISEKYKQLRITFAQKVADYGIPDVYDKNASAFFEQDEKFYIATGNDAFIVNDTKGFSENMKTKLLKRVDNKELILNATVKEDPKPNTPWGFKVDVESIDFTA